jgi:Spy/CpxP family protein refolding chaperone
VQRNWIGIALAISLLLNVGVLGGVGYQAWRLGALPELSAYFGMPHEQLPDYLGLDAAQRAKWREIEAGFLAGLTDDARAIRAHRERMIHEIFGARPDAAVVERERAQIFARQEAQQRRIVDQLLRERDLLSPEQRAKLADLLVRQAPGGATVERLHDETRR